VRDPQAISAVEQALAALGGNASSLQVRTAVIRGNLQVEAEQTASTFLWEDDLSGKVPEFRKEIHSGDAVRTFVSGHGLPAHEHNGEAKPLSPQIGIATSPLYLPGVVLARKLHNPDYSFQLVEDNSGFIHVRTSWVLNPATASVTPQDWYFDPTTKIPVWVQYLLPNTEKPGHVKAVSLRFSEFRNVSGIAVPFHIVTQGPDSRIRTATLTDVQVNAAPLNRTDFEVHGGRQ